MRLKQNQVLALERVSLVSGTPSRRAFTVAFASGRTTSPGTIPRLRSRRSCALAAGRSDSASIQAFPCITPHLVSRRLSNLQTKSELTDSSLWMRLIASPSSRATVSTTILGPPRLGAQRDRVGHDHLALERSFRSAAWPAPDSTAWVQQARIAGAPFSFSAVAASAKRAGGVDDVVERTRSSPRRRRCASPRPRWRARGACR